MASIGTPFTDGATRVMLCGSGELGKEVVILCHHYQRADVYQHADLTGDSLKLSRLASQTDSKYVIFCGVHFMAEVADIMTAPHQIAILPDCRSLCPRGS